MKSRDSLTQSGIFKFWAPLAATWLMMAFEGPFLAGIIARLPMEKINLAAYGVSYALALVTEAPVIMLLSASVALVTSPSGFRKMRRFTYMMCTITTLFILKSEQTGRIRYRHPYAVHVCLRISAVLF